MMQLRQLIVSIAVLVSLPIFLSALGSTPALAGETDASLQEILQSTPPDQVISVLVYLEAQVDLAAVTEQMDAQHATLRERHETVVRGLQQTAESTQDELASFLTQLQLEGVVKSFKPFWIVNAFAVQVMSSDVGRIASRPEVGKVYFNYEIELIKPVESKKDDGHTITAETGVEAVNAPQCWAMGIDGSGVLVSTLDTGVDGNHPALAGRWAGVADSRYEGHPEWAWYDPLFLNNFPYDGGYHGTHTMGTVCGGSPGDDIGVAPGAHWIAAAPIDRVDIPTTVEDAIESFQWLVDPDSNPSTDWDVPAVCSNSWGLTTGHGYPPCDETFWTYLDACEAAGIVILFSAGNEGTSGLRRPADRATDDYRTCAVAAVDANDPAWPIASFSSRGPTYCTPNGSAATKPDIAAPGVDVRSSFPGGSYGYLSGTSMASPHVNGVVALIRQANPNISVNEIKQVIYDTAHDLGPAGEDNAYGWGMVDAYQAVLAVSGDLGRVEGHIYETDNGFPVPGTVEAVGTSISAQADENGFYSMLLPADTYTLRAVYHGYIPDEAVVDVPVDDTVTQDFNTIPPDISSNPSSYSVSALPGEIATRNLYIDNNGQGDLYFSLSTYTSNRLRGEEGDESTDRVIDPEPIGYITDESAKESDRVVPQYPPVITGQGGPDAFGHKWIDSDESGGPPVSWVDISGSGTPLYMSDDDYSGPINIGFNFQFYDNSYSQLYIGSNGMLTFGSGSTTYSNTGIPNSTSPNNMIAALWDDLYPPSGGVIYYYQDAANSRFIVSWVGIAFYYATGSANFQAIIYPNGNIELNYGSLDGGSHGLSSATIGIENIDASDGLQVVYDAPYLHSDLSIKISNTWLSAEPAGGIVPGSGGSYTATVTFDASDLDGGIYTGNVNLGSDDPDTPLITIPVTFNVGALPSGTLEGTVTDVNSNPISGVNVHADDGAGHTGDASTNGSGFYTMGLAEGTYSVNFTHSGYQDLTIPGVVIIDGQTTVQDAVMEEISNDIPTLSEWGMMILGLLLLAMGTVAVVRRRRRAPQIL